ncbi:MAG: DUF4115 domain-containing protein [Candidatus Velamenicoccus archaeovorus]
MRISVEDLERTADEAADLDAAVRRELSRAAGIEAPPLRALLSGPRPTRTRTIARLLVLLSVVGLIATVASQDAGTGADRAPSAAPAPRAVPSEVLPHPTPSARSWQELHVRLTFSAPCWVEAIADGVTAVRRTVSEGSVAVRADRSVSLTLGNAGGVRVVANGRSVPTGPFGQVVHLGLALRDGRLVVER